MKDLFRWEHFRKHLLKGMKVPYILVQNELESILTVHLKIRKDIWDNVNMLLEGSELTKEDRKSKLFVTAVKLNRGLRDFNYDQLYAYLKQHEAYANENKMMPHSKECTQPKQPQNLKYFKDKMLLMQAQENRVALDGEQLMFIKVGQDNMVDEDVDEQSVQDLALNMDNVFQADDYPVSDEVGLSYDSDILSEVHDHDHYQDAICEHHEAHEMHDDVQPNCIVDSDTDYTGDSNMIPYDQYVKDSAEPVVQNNVSSVPNDAYMMVINEMHEHSAQSVSANKHNKVVNASLTAKLATYKEHVELYVRRAKFELIKREQKIEEQLRVVITDCNIKEENLKKELHSVKMQLTSTINHNKSMVEEVRSLKKDFKQKENKYLEEFLDMKALKEKDVLKMKAEALKEQISPQLHEQSKRWEGGFEQTKECYLTEVISFFKTLKEHFEGNQKALTKEIKEMKEIFKELEAEVDQNVMNRKYDEIERKNILIANDNLIVNFLSKEVFYIATNFELTVSRFSEMHDAHTVVQSPGT
ncbi:hypothetical protein Tco_1133902 [Tanacetum coccineum]